MERLILVGCFALGACAGQDGADGEKGSRGRDGESAVVETSEASINECPAGGTVLTVGVGDETEEIVLCNGENGEPGEPGESGPAGEQGTQGPAGEAGAPAEGLGRIEASIFCGGQLEGVTLWFTYDAVLFTDGSLWASAEIKDPFSQASGSQFFAPTQAGAATGAVQVTMDQAQPANAGFWSVSLDRTDLEVTIEYFDSDLANGSQSWVMDSEQSGCVLNEY